MKTLNMMFRAALLLMIGTAMPAQAQFSNETRTVSNRGTTAGEFLMIPVGARATAMGNAVTAQVDDMTSVYWNPAGLALMTQGGVAFESAKWLNAINFNYGAAAMPLAGGTFGVGITSLRTPEMEVRTVEEQDGTGETFAASSMALSFAYARKLTDRFAIGGTAKIITERIWHSAASGVAIDIGTTFVTPFKGVRLGASISNFGTKMQMNGDDLLITTDIDPNANGNNESQRGNLRTDRFGLPLVMRIGLAGEVLKTKQARMTLAVDALSPNNSEQFVNIGTEIGLLGDLVMLRAGYNELLLKDSARGLTAGGGLRYRFGSLNMGVDYAYETFKYFTPINRFTLSLKF